VAERLVLPMRFVTHEGNAVFCYADAASFKEGERFVELLEASYFDFSNRCWTENETISQVRT
jgi:hypothetical protein